MLVLLDGLMCRMSDIIEVTKVFLELAIYFMPRLGSSAGPGPKLFQVRKHMTSLSFPMGPYDIY
jgi:hypothetical protein